MYRRSENSLPTTQRCSLLPNFIPIADESESHNFHKFPLKLRDILMQLQNSAGFSAFHFMLLQDFVKDSGIPSFITLKHFHHRNSILLLRQGVAAFLHVAPLLMSLSFLHFLHKYVSNTLIGINRLIATERDDNAGSSGHRGI